MLATTSQGKEMTDDLANFIAIWPVVLLPVAGVAYFFCKQSGFSPGMPLRLIALSTPGLLLAVISLYSMLDGFDIIGFLIVSIMVFPTNAISIFSIIYALIVKFRFSDKGTRFGWKEGLCIALLLIGYAYDQAMGYGLSQGDS